MDRRAERDLGDRQRVAQPRLGIRTGDDDVAGVLPVCGTNSFNPPTYLRQRLQDRVSVAFITGETDFNRKENEVYMFPYFQELGIRSELWVYVAMDAPVKFSVLKVRNESGRSRKLSVVGCNLICRL